MDLLKLAHIFEALATVQFSEEHPLRRELGEYGHSIYSRDNPLLQGPTFNFRKVDNKLWRGGALDESQLEILKDMGITYILSLDADSGLYIAPYCHRLGIKHKIIPIHWATPKAAKEVATEMAKVQSRPGITYMHCKYGKDRTGLAAAIYSMLNGKSTDEAIREQKRYQMGVGDPWLENSLVSAIRSLDQGAEGLSEEPMGSFTDPQQRPQVNASLGMICKCAGQFLKTAAHHR
ncbi:MAG TPA: tyrosine-protein phosphatase [Desulfosporosinus sp.]|nr:tyrosine-protein phosphatase [Desulfosporosinus sp.]